MLDAGCWMLDAGCYHPASSIQHLLSILHQPSSSKIDDPISIAGINFGVSHLDDRRPLGTQLFEHFHNLFTLARMEIAGRFISQNDLRVGDHSARDADQ